MNQSDPLAVPGVLTIPLPPEVAATLDGPAFVLLGWGTYPTSAGQRVAYVLPCPMERANAATLVALGRAKAVKIRKAVDTADLVTGGKVDNPNA